MGLVAAIGRAALREASAIHQTAAVAGSAILAITRPHMWPRTVRDMLARQMLFTGVDGIRYVSLVAAAVGIVVVVQSQYWLQQVGQTALLGPILVTVIVRELAPLLTNFIVIGRSGTAMAAELGTMRVMGEVSVLDSQGVDPFLFLLLPRVYATVISVFCLTIVFILVALAAGYVSGSLLGVNTGNASQFVQSIFESMKPSDIITLFAKTIVIGFLTGTICCLEGLSVGRARTAVPQAATRAVMRSITMLFIISALASVLSYT